MSRAREGHLDVAPRKCGGKGTPAGQKYISLTSAEWKCLMEIKFSRGEIKQVVFHAHLSLWLQFIPFSDEQQSGN